jgi:endoglucanase
MRRLIVPLLLFVLFSPTAAAEECVYPAAASKTVTLKRGINLSGWWDNDPRRGLPREELARLRKLGFDFVRLPVESLWFEEDEAEPLAETMSQLRCDVITLLKAGFSVIVDFHPSGPFRERFAHATPKERLAEITKIWKSLAQPLKGSPPDRVLFELYNEPSISTKDWWPVQEKLIRYLRKSFPHHTFVASENPGDSGFRPLQAYSDKNLIYDFHFYAPMFFTHHGAEWSEDFRHQKGIAFYPAWPGKEMDEDTRAYIREGWNQEKMAEIFADINAWKKRHGVRIACLEFGVYRPHTDAKSRGRWLHDMRVSLEGADIPWALWDYNQGFGLFEGGKPDLHMVKALGLRYGGKP